MRLILIIPILLLTSCLTKKRLDRICQMCPTKVEVKDSIREVVTTKDTTIYITQKGDSIYVPCDTSTFTKVIKKDGIKLTINKNKHGVNAKCDVDSLKAVIEGLNKEITITKSHKEVKTIQLACIEPHVKWYHNVAIWIASFYLLFTIFYFAIKLK